MSEFRYNDRTPLRPVLRFDRPSEWPRLQALFKASFGREREATLVEELRAAERFLFLIVAEIDGGFVGAIGCSDAEIIGEETTLRAAIVFPVAVAPAYRGREIGSALVRAALAQCRRRHIDAALAVGATRFFGRLGFAPEAAAAIDAPWFGPHFQALALRDDLGSMAGDAETPAPFRALQEE